MSLILTKAQAEAVYSAMCALNKIGANLDTTVPLGSDARGLTVRVCEAFSGSVNLYNDRVYLAEHHQDKAAFAVAYGLSSDEYPNAADAGGLTQTPVEY